MKKLLDVSKIKKVFLRADILALLLLCIMTVLFYWPEIDPLQSRYVYYADSFERAGKILNPDYKTEYQRYQYEEVCPLATLLARYSLVIFRHHVGSAVTFLYFGLALIATLLTFFANRYYFSTLSSFFITVLLLFDRVLMPVARGLGVIGTLLLIPLLLIFIFNLAQTQKQKVPCRRKIIPIAMIAISGSLIYSLGSHETLYAIICLFGFFFVLTLKYIICKIQGRDCQGLSVASMVGLSMTGILAVIIFALTVFGIAKEQQPSSFKKAFFYQNFIEYSMQDLRGEPVFAKKNRHLLLRSTFIEGRYLTEWGQHHQNVFLYSGKGFNGIIPLFILPGFALGLFPFLRQFVLLFFPSQTQTVSKQKEYIIVFNAVLLVFFVAAVYLSGDPKPTRYTLCIFPILSLSTQGYEMLLRKLNHIWTSLFFVGSQQRNMYIRKILRVPIFLVLVLICAASTIRIFKNYQDLQTYYRVYQNQIPTIAFNQIWDKLNAEHDSNPIYILGNWEGKPAIGLWMRFQNSRKNIILKEKINEKEIPPNSVVYFWDGSATIQRYK